MKTKKLTLCALLVAVAIIFGYIEALFPIPIAIPGIKLGLGNIVVLVCLYNFSHKTTWSVMLIKVVVTSLLFSSPSALLYSLCGGVLSLIAMSIMKKFGFNILNVSICGGILHNVGQLTMASLILKNINTLYYLPMLIISGAVVSVATGAAAQLTNKHINKII